jgi:hypothetical protein
MTKGETTTDNKANTKKILKKKSAENLRENLLRRKNSKKSVH